MDMKEFGEYFAEIRKREGYKSQRDLAERSGISNATISRLESSVTKPTPEVLRELANCFVSVTYEELMQNAGYLSIEEAVDEFKEVYEVSKKLGDKFREIAHLLRFSKIYIRGKTLGNFLSKKNIDLMTIAENVDLRLIDMYEILTNKKPIPLDVAVRLAMYYKFPFAEAFKIEPSFVVSDEPFDEELLLIRIEDAIEEQLEEVSKRTFAIKSKEVQEFVSIDLRKTLLGFINTMNEDEIEYLYEQVLLYRRMNLKSDSLKIK